MDRRLVGRVHHLRSAPLDAGYPFPGVSQGSGEREKESPGNQDEGSAAAAGEH